MNIPEKYRVWIEAGKRHRLSHAHVQMARELGINPKKLGKLDNHKQESWKAPLPEFIEHCYFKRFGKDRPDQVRSIEEILKADGQKKRQKRQKKLLKRQENCGVRNDDHASAESVGHEGIGPQQQVLSPVAQAPSPKSEASAPSGERARIPGRAAGGAAFVYSTGKSKVLVAASLPYRIIRTVCEHVFLHF